MNQTAPLTFREVLQLKPVRRLWLAQMVSVFGDRLALFAVLSVVSFKLHGTATQATLISVFFMLPFAFSGPLRAVYMRDDLHADAIAFGVINALIGVDMIFSASVVPLVLFAAGGYFRLPKATTVKAGAATP